MKKNKTPKVKAKSKTSETVFQETATVSKELMAELSELGDRLAKREGYEQVSGLEAVWYYLIQKYHWTPFKVRSMRLNDMYFCLKEERL